MGVSNETLIFQRFLVKGRRQRLAHQRVLRLSSTGGFGDPCQLKNTPVPPLTGGGGLNSLRAVRRARFGNSFSTILAPFLSRLLFLGITFGGLEMQLSGTKTDFGAQGQACP